MMRKESSEGVTCTWCDKPAVKGTEPPACVEHAQRSLEKTAEEGPNTLKELESGPDTTR